jgi:hypothetical protein
MVGDAAPIPADEVGDTAASLRTGRGRACRGIIASRLLAQMSPQSRRPSARSNAAGARETTALDPTGRGRRRSESARFHESPASGPRM